MEFNEWTFRGADQRVEPFFAELSAEMGEANDLRHIGQVFSKYGDISVRKEITGALEARNKPIVVVLDDVDRHSVSEIRDIFKLVRLTASFPTSSTSWSATASASGRPLTRLDCRRATIWRKSFNCVRFAGDLAP